MVKLSIIIVNWNTAKLLSGCLKSLEFEIRNSKFEIIVVDNGSTDGSVEMVKDYFKKYSCGFVSGTEKMSKKEELHVPPIRVNSCKPTVKLIENRANLGFAKGNNIGIKQAKGEYIMLLNTDTIVKEGAIEKLLFTFEKQPYNVGAVSPLVLSPDGSVQKDPCFLKFPSPMLVLFYYNSFLKKVALKFFPELLFSVIDFSRPSLVDQLPGAAIMIRKQVLDKIGVFDEDYRIYFEDTDLCFRMKKAGYELLLVPEAEIIHLARQSIKPLIDKEGIEKFYLLNFESLFRFCKKHYSFVKYQAVKIIILKHMLITMKFDLFRKLLIF